MSRPALHNERLTAICAFPIMKDDQNCPLCILWQMWPLAIIEETAWLRQDESKYVDDLPMHNCVSLKILDCQC